ncbi:universal stress protein [Haladaptatus halobius]|uniref:universal stress protein n=1 Tax=Haladaptatus halobius TaxID=2884875 RepID=UPI001D0BAF61|nr:universal stress protein [Haladaptatus halobius]
MPETLFQKILVPVASESDAETTCQALLPYLDRDTSEAKIVHVIEKADGAPDKASPEQLQEEAEKMFDRAIEQFTNADFTNFETEVRYGTNVADAIVDAGREYGASAIVFTPRGGKRWTRLLTGDVANSLLTNTDRPVITLPPEEDSHG